MNFIKLTAMNGNQMRINMDLIESYGTINENAFKNAGNCVGYTYLIPTGLTDEEETYVVKETPDEIAAILER